MYTLVFAASEMRLFAIVAFMYPVVPLGPVTAKLNSELVLLKASAETVLFDSTWKKFWLS
jgi:hypothetical protein